MDSNLIVHASGNGLTRGSELGNALGGQLELAWQRWSHHFKSKGIEPNEFAQKLSTLPLWQTVRSLFPDLSDELESMAETAKVNWSKVAALCLLDESWALSGGMACTAVALTRSENIVAGQNMDLPQWTDTLQTVLKLKLENGLELICATYPGSLATCGTNSNGVVVIVNALDLATDMSGVPASYVTRGALSCASAKEAIELIKNIPHAVGQCYTVIDEHDIFMVEAAADGVIELALNEEVNWHTNHAFTKPHEISKSSLARWQAVEHAASQLNNASDLMNLLNDKKSGVCQTQGFFGTDMYSFMGIVGDCKAKRTWVNFAPSKDTGFIEVT